MDQESPGAAGVSNDFLINTWNETALIYNDVSVNENMHLATAFKILRRPGNDLMEHLSPEQYRFFRRTVIQIVLATDMAGHSELLQVSSAMFIAVRSLSALQSRYSIFATGKHCMQHVCSCLPDRHTHSGHPYCMPLMHEQLMHSCPTTVAVTDAHEDTLCFNACTRLMQAAEACAACELLSLPQAFNANLKLLGPDLEAWGADQRSLALRMCVHCADIANPAKPLPLALQWTQRVVTEFFNQVWL